MYLATKMKAMHWHNVVSAYSAMVKMWQFLLINLLLRPQR